MPATLPISTTTIPATLDINSSYFIYQEWCMGDSLAVINHDIKYFQDKKVTKTGDTMTGALTVQADLTVTAGGDLDIDNGKLNHFTVTVMGASIAPGSTNIPLAVTDCGKVIYVTATANGTITVPGGLPVGYSVMIVNNSAFNVSIVGAAGVAVQNVYNKITIGIKYGICNLIVIDTNKVLISGDLS
jgi:hypothetical protein